MIEPQTCECCGDHHMDVGEVDGIRLCFLCQPCDVCGLSGTDCDPCGGPAGTTTVCVTPPASGEDER